MAIPPNWSAQAAQAEVDRGWLAAFDDPHLTALVHEALERNPDLLVAAARVEQANAQVDIAQAQLLPAIGLLGRGGSKPVADLVPLLSGVMLRMSWEIDLWGRLRYARNAAIAASDAQNADYRYAQQSLAASVALMRCSAVCASPLSLASSPSMPESSRSIWATRVSTPLRRL